MKLTLQHTISDYLVALDTQHGLAATTIQSRRLALTALHRHVCAQARVGEDKGIQLKSVTKRHIDTFVTERRKTRSESSVNIDLVCLRSWRDWCRENYPGLSKWDPVGTRRRLKETDKLRMRVSAALFPNVIETAWRSHPRVAVLIALGFYGCLRVSEIRTVTVGDARAALDTGRLPMRRHKTRQVDELPVWSELDHQLRRYLTWYAQHAPITHASHLIPAIRVIGSRGPGQILSALDATRCPSADRLVAMMRAAFASCGIDIPKGQGIHVLRRSGALAIYQATGDIEVARTMLGHATERMTRLYIGEEIHKERRNLAIQGRSLFPAVERIDGGRSAAEGM